jgi:hypothetical protein
MYRISIVQYAISLGNSRVLWKLYETQIENETNYEKRMEYLVVFSIEIKKEFKCEIERAIFDQMATISDDEEFAVIDKGSLFLGIRKRDQFFITR